MKIWVDHVPTEPHECLFYKNMGFFCVCSICDKDTVICALEKGEKCPYLQALCGSQSW